MNEENVEVLQNETEVEETFTEVVAVDYTEILEQIYGEMESQTEALVAIRDEQADLNDAIGGLSAVFGIFVVFGIVEFCWSCMRQWRKNVLKMGE